MKRIAFELDYEPPYSLHYHAGEDGAVLRSFWLRGKPIVMRLEQRKANTPVVAQAFSDEHIGSLGDELQHAAHHMIGGSDDLRGFRAAIDKDKRLGKLVDALPGYKAMRGPDLWTMMLSSLVAQQISGAAARSIRNKLARTYGHVVRVGNEDVPVVPSAQRLYDLREDELRAVGFSQKKAEYARGMAQALLDGTIVPDELKRMPPDEMIKKLSSLRGVGVWTAECIGIFCIGHPDLIPADDLGIQKAITHLYKLKADPKPKEVRARGEKWKGWRSYATTYLWAGLNHAILVPRKIPAAP
jgi:DNA-3-methyladenine glycosylase II